MKTKSEKLKVKNDSLKRKIFKFYAMVFSFTLLALSFTKVYALSPTPTLKITPTPTTKQSKITPTPKISGQPSPTPTSTEDEKIKEIRDAIKEKVNEIKEKVEKKAYVGTISQITDSTLTLNNFRGKQRVRLLPETILISASKKEIKPKDLAVDDKVIALGTITDNEILEAKRVIVVLKPKIVPSQRLIIAGTIAKVDSKSLFITVNALKNLDLSVEVKITDKTSLVSLADAKAKLKFKDLKENQKVIAVYTTDTNNKTTASSVFLLP